MIHTYGAPDAPVPRLMLALAQRGHVVESGGPPDRQDGTTLLLGPGIELEPMALGVLLGAWRSAPGARVLVLSLLGVHPDARSPRLKTLWETEELVRASGIPSLTLRLAPLVGPASPMWAQLSQRPRLPRGGRDLVQPIVEDDVVEAIDRALTGRAAWQGWHEMAGPETFNLSELRELASAQGPQPGLAAWEPALSELREQRMAEPDLWQREFDQKARDIRELAASWAA